MSTTVSHPKTSTFHHFDLHEPIQKALQVCGYETPTPVQAKAIPLILEGKDVVVTAQTGTGKTAAFTLPALNRLSQQPTKSKKPRILILTPTRELATQVAAAVRLYGKFLRFSIVSLVGGMPYPRQTQELSRGADVIIATPGRLLDHIEQKRIDLSQIEILILDEADRMLDMGFIDDVTYIAKLTPQERQTLLFSATLDKQLTAIIKQLLKNPVRVDLSDTKIAAPHIKQLMYKTANPHQKNQLLKKLLAEEQIYKAIIFTATKIYADKLADHLLEQGFAAAAIHGDLRQNVRNRTLERFKTNKVQFLVATDVAARGIDVRDVTHVINYDLPRFCEDYVHRIGRTGRAGKSGTAISFVSPTDQKHLQRIERYTGERVKLMQAEGLSTALASSPTSASHDDHKRKRPAKEGAAKDYTTATSRPVKYRSSKPKPIGERAARYERREHYERDEEATDARPAKRHRYAKTEYARSSAQPSKGKKPFHSRGKPEHGKHHQTKTHDKPYGYGKKGPTKGPAKESAAPHAADRPSFGKKPFAKKPGTAPRRDASFKPFKKRSNKGN